MKTIAIAGSMHVDLDVIGKIAAEQLGMRRPEAADAPPLDPAAAVRPFMPHMDVAIEEVIDAINKLDRDQHTRAEAAAIRRLVRAAKQLRVADRQAQSLIIKGKFHV